MSEKSTFSLRNFIRLTSLEQGIEIYQLIKIEIDIALQYFHINVPYMIN